MKGEGTMTRKLIALLLAVAMIACCAAAAAEAPYGPTYDLSLIHI